MFSNTRFCCLYVNSFDVLQMSIVDHKITLRSNHICRIYNLCVLTQKYVEWFVTISSMKFYSWKMSKTTMNQWSIPGSIELQSCIDRTDVHRDCNGVISCGPPTTNGGSMVIASQRQMCYSVFAENHLLVNLEYTENIENHALEMYNKSGYLSLMTTYHDQPSIWHATRFYPACKFQE